MHLDASGRDFAADLARALFGQVVTRTKIETAIFAFTSRLHAALPMSNASFGKWDSSNSESASVGGRAK